MNKFETLYFKLLYDHIFTMLSVIDSKKIKCHQKIDDDVLLSKN